ncbi:hypothetical protein NKJ88_27235 [Mesorhizobium sp. M0016]|uniref:hypothetical protein n=1 Tax=Mesorhizobium sp. M0016 TaxID=2956843 RepID=UPI0033398405
MVRAFFWSIMLTFCLLYSNMQAEAAVCVVADPTGTRLNYRDQPSGAILGSLKNGLTVFSKDREGRWVSVVDISGFSIGYVYSMYIKCNDFSVSSKYPVLLGFDQLRNLGIDYSNKPKNKSKECFYIGDGLINLRVYREVLRRLETSKIDFDAYCFVTRADGLRFDPETGARLRTMWPYELGEEFQFEFPLEVPRCLRKAKVRIRPSGWFAQISFASCDLRYNPVTGASISDADKEFLLDKGLRLSGEAGPEPSETSVASVRSKKPATSSQLRELKKALEQPSEPVR